MIARIFVFLTFVFFACGCSAEKKYYPAGDPNHIASSSDIDAVFESFSDAVSEKNVELFINLANPKGIHLVRKFTSGTLGGRGPELSERIDPKKINAKLQFPIKDQIPYSIRIQFQELPVKSFKAISRQVLAADVETSNFDRWAPYLKESLMGTTESASRAPIILSSANSKYYVYAEAQIIDDILVGGFAVFAMTDGKLQLVALIELL